MIFKANLNEALRSLQSAKQRTALALVGIVIGIGSVIAMVSIGTIAQQESLRQFKELGTDVLTIEKEFLADDDPRAARAPRFDLAGVMSLPAQVPVIGHVSPFTQGGSGEAIYKGQPLSQAHLMGVTESFLDMNKLRLAEGRALSDLDARSRYVMVGAQVAEQMRQRGHPTVIGQSLRMGDHVFTVVGALTQASQANTRRFDPNHAILVHASTALRMPGVEISVVNARVRPGTSNATAAALVQSFFAQQPGAPAVRVSSPEELIAQMEKQMQMYTLLLGAIGSISLVVGGVGVMNVMLVSVSERRKEIGIRRALGARQGDIRGQFLIESVILSLIGGLLGVVLGEVAAWIVCQMANWQFVVSAGAITLGVGVSSAVGIFFGFYPANQAAQLDPIVALRAG